MEIKNLKKAAKRIIKAVENNENYQKQLSSAPKNYLLKTELLTTR